MCAGAQWLEDTTQFRTERAAKRELIIRCLLIGVSGVYVAHEHIYFMYTVQ